MGRVPALTRRRGMHILLTDILVCPRCGPHHGLILLADRIEDRRVLDGRLGCANCREKYPVSGGIGDFTAGDPAVSADASPQAAPSAEAATRFAALMGLGRSATWTLLAGPAAVHAPALADLLEGLEVVATPPLPGPERPGVNSIAVADRLPLASARMAGITLTGSTAHTLLEEAARALSPVGRLVIELPPADAARRLDAAGMRIVAQDENTLVAARA
jgi:uncharacterized protein YbaR (Trm112 family)